MLVKCISGLTLVIQAFQVGHSKQPIYQRMWVQLCGVGRSPEKKNSNPPSFRLQNHMGAGGALMGYSHHMVLQRVGLRD